MEEVAIIADSKGRGYYFANGIYYYLMSRENRDFSVNLVDIEKVIFKDGEFKMRINDNIRRKKCFFVHDSNKTACEWFTEQNVKQSFCEAKIWENFVALKGVNEVKKFSA